MRFQMMSVSQSVSINIACPIQFPNLILVQIQRQKKVGNAVAVLPGKFLLVRKVFTRWTPKCLKMVKNIPRNVKNIRTMWKVSGKFGKCPDNLESVRTIWKVYGNLKNVQIIWKVPGQSGKCPDNLKTASTFWKVWKVSTQAKKCPDGVKSLKWVHTGWKVTW